MPEPATTAAALAAAASTAATGDTATGITLGAMLPRPEIQLLSGVFFGALVFLLRSKEQSRLKKGIYFCVSLSGGYYVAPHVNLWLAWLPVWPSGFLSAALIVVLAMIALDWAETVFPQFLGRLAARFLGGPRDE